jgi:hypothetical protein
LANHVFQWGCNHPCWDYSIHCLQMPTALLANQHQSIAQCDSDNKGQSSSIVRWALHLTLWRYMTYKNSSPSKR